MSKVQVRKVNVQFGSFMGGGMGLEWVKMRGLCVMREKNWESEYSMLRHWYDTVYASIS